MGLLFVVIVLSLCVLGIALTGLYFLNRVVDDNNLGQAQGPERP